MVTRSKFAGIAAVLGATVVGPACIDTLGAARYAEREEKRFTVSGKPDVSLSTFDGSIEIRSTDRSEVAVTIEKQAATQEAMARIEVRFLIDANLPRAVIGVVQSLGHEVEFARDIGLASATDEQIANVLTYVRNSWGNSGDTVAADEVGRIRKETPPPASNPYE